MSYKSSFTIRLEDIDFLKLNLLKIGVWISESNVEIIYY